VISDPLARLIQDVCRYIEDHDPCEGSLTLASIGEHVHVSPYHLQKVFKRMMGITPRQYAEARRLGRLKPLIKKRQDVTTALYEAGYASSSRLYERASARLGMTPGTYLRGGKGIRIRYTIVDSPLGRLLVAVTEKGICAVNFGDSDEVLERDLLGEYPAAEVLREDGDLGEWVSVLLQHLKGWKPHLDLPLDVQVTTFQWRVYEELRTTPYGNTRSYGEIAESLGQPKAVRAVAKACAQNPAALVIPCHRAVRKDGGLGGYRWGIERKREILEIEAQFSKKTYLGKEES
jgi:AraC family transcriptional regulator of adaptative response/methylated-DNA-[protein]-cysteine methyltransferase